SAHNIWAVGDYPTGQAQGRLTMIARWNGTKWKLVPSPNVSGPSLINILLGVSASSGSTAWAVGFFDKAVPRPFLSVALRWNGKVWRRVTTPHPGHGHGDVLGAVDALSARNALAVGDRKTARNLIENAAMHWTGRTWNVVPSLAPPAPRESTLNGV